MDELDLAKRAVFRGLITEDQLREAQSYARGGRSLFSVLLDLGYLRIEDVPALGGPPHPASTPSQGRRLRLGFLCGLSLVAGLLGGRSCASTRVVSFRMPEPPGPIEDSVSEQLARRGEELMSQAERTPEPKQSDLVERAGALFAEALEQGSLPPSSVRAFARARELQGRTGDAFELYRTFLQARPEEPQGLLGAARTALAQKRISEAHGYADAALRRLSSADGHLVRGQTRYALGEREGARKDLLTAKAMLDGRLPPDAEFLLRSLQPVGVAR